MLSWIFHVWEVLKNILQMSNIRGSDKMIINSVLPKVSARNRSFVLRMTSRGFLCQSHLFSHSTLSKVSKHVLETSESHLVQGQWVTCCLCFDLDKRTNWLNCSLETAGALWTHSRRESHSVNIPSSTVIRINLKQKTQEKREVDDVTTMT